MTAAGERRSRGQKPCRAQLELACVLRAGSVRGVDDSLLLLSSSPSSLRVGDEGISDGEVFGASSLGRGRAAASREQTIRKSAQLTQTSTASTQSPTFVTSSASASASAMLSSPPPTESIVFDLLHHPTNPKTGHTASETALIWTHLLAIYFTPSKGFRISTTTATEDNSSTDEVFVEVWATGRGYFTASGLWIIAADVPIFVASCLAREAWTTEMVGSRHSATSLASIIPTTSGQLRLRGRLIGLQRRYAAVSPLTGAVACGEMVRLFRWKPELTTAPVRGGGLTGGKTGGMNDVDGGDEFKCWHKGSLDLVSGNPMAAMGVVEMVLQRIAEPACYKSRGAGLMKAS